MKLAAHQLVTEYPFNPDPNAPFGNTEEFSAALHSPKYATDEAYRQAVEQRLSITDRSSWGMANHRPLINSKFEGRFELTRDDSAEAEQRW